MQSEESLKDILQKNYSKIFVVHRLDKETSGVIVFAKNEEMHKTLSLQFENRETVKHYSGLVIGSLLKTSGVVDLPIIEHPAKKGMMITATKGKPSVTEYEVIENFKSYSFMQFNLLTGRTHQIRVHMKYLGHPLVCDPLYGDGKPLFISDIKKKYKLSKEELEERPILGRLALHSQQLIIHTDTDKELLLEAPVPKDLKAAMQQLRKQAVK
jgi:23S rRNA pseudouridine955/2504/2580 synthase/23S rRNA pseudouridine1911/1915/1917 synthase